MGRWEKGRLGEKVIPFPDVIDALHKLRPRFQLVILSNGDRDMLENAKPFIGFEFDLTISVEEAGYFKPHYATYQKAEERIGEARSSIMHVANHAFDCIGAKAYGMRTAFIDRRNRPYGETPHQPDLFSHQLIGVGHQATQHGKGFGGQRQHLLTTPQAFIEHIQAKRRKLDNGR